MRKNQSDKSFFLNKVQIDPSRNLICADGDATRVEPRVMALLLKLKQNMGHTLSRSQLIESVWGDNSGSDEALTQTVSKLRRALGDKVSSQVIIETVPKRGYRLMLGSDEPDNLSTLSSIKKIPIKQTHLLWSAIALLLLLILFDNTNKPVSEQYEIELVLE